MMQWTLMVPVATVAIVLEKLLMKLNCPLTKITHHINQYMQMIDK